MALLRKGRVLESPFSGKRYQVTGVLGEGGFAEAYCATEIDRAGEPIRSVCLKVTRDQSAWHREAYFGELLSGNRRVIQMYESFPLPSASGGNKKGFCYFLTFELAQYGSLGSYLKQNPKPWPQDRARREIVALLKALNQLHGASATHRDLTPSNVLVCKNCTLKLADFGIASHALGGRPSAADAFNPSFVTRGFVEEEHRYWLTVDDVYQMGQLLAMLLLGDASQLVTPKQVAKLDCDDRLKGIVKKSIGPRSQRYSDASEMLEALEGKKDGPAGGVLSLSGKTVVFTGPLSIPRLDADVLVLQAGGTVARAVTKATDVVVQGGRSPLYKAQHKGRKLLAIEKLNRQGADIRIIGEAEFRQLVSMPGKG